MSAGSYRNGDSQDDSGRWVSDNPSAHGLTNGSARAEDNQGSSWVPSASEGAFGYGSSQSYGSSRDNYGTSQNFGSSSYANDYNSERNSYSFADRGYNSVERGYNPVSSGFPMGQASSYKDPDSILKELGKCYLSTLSNGGAPGPQAPSGYGKYSRGNYSYSGGYGRSNSSRPRGQGRSNSRQGKRHRESSQSGPSGSGNKNQKRQRLNSGRQPDTNQAKQSSAKPQLNGSKSGEIRKRNNRRNITRKRSENVREVREGQPNTENKTSNPVATNEVKKNKSCLRQGVKAGNKTRMSRRFNKLNENKFLDDKGRVLVAFLRKSLEDVIPEDHSHSILVYYYLIKHRNAVQLYQYEVKTSLDKKFGTETDEETKKAKRDYLNAEKIKVLEELKILYEEESNEEVNGKLIDECIDVVTKDVYPEELVPKEKDYVENPEVTRTLEDLTHEFQFQFLWFVYDQFGYSLPQKRGTFEQKLKFHLNNGIIPALLVEVAQSPTLRLGDGIDLPATLAKELARWNYNSMFLRQKSENFNKAIIRKLVAQNEHLQTSVLDLLPSGTKWSTKFVRDFSEVILMFDNIATVAKYKLIHYTPCINLTKEVKEGIFNELVNNVYSEVLEVLKNDVPLRDRTFEKMEGVTDDEDKTETQDTEGENKDNNTSANEKTDEVMDY